MVGRADFAFERDFPAAIHEFLGLGCSDRFVSIAVPFATSPTRRTRPVIIDASFQKRELPEKGVKRRRDPLYWPQADARREVPGTNCGVGACEISMTAIIVDA